ncbi:primosomal protein N' [Alicyclobacillus tolerans]|uniref:replication restart helicase PriA n=1 Tax=Alicyclobacillus tolerans TaxID=90970 RepID=UPI001F00EB80|nr:primosomal protein N' [Alicyclobacillus tolerans]MCF8564427.1 primosomal protein N' [Alicyclobacillus tolerans]
MSFVSGSDRLVAQVVVDVPSKAVNRLFDYEVPPRLEPCIRKGHRVYVSFGKQYCQAYVVNLYRQTDSQAAARESGAKEHGDPRELLSMSVLQGSSSARRASARASAHATSRTLKPVLALLGDGPALTEEMLQLSKWLCHRTVCTQLEAISALLPSAFRVHSVHRFRAAVNVADGVGDEKDEVIAAQASSVEHTASNFPSEQLEPGSLLSSIYRALKTRTKTLPQLMQQFGPEAALGLEQLLALGLAQEVIALKDEVQAKMEWLLLAAVDEPQLKAAHQQRQKRAPKQAQLLEKMIEQSSWPLSALGMTASDSSVQALVRQGLVRLLSKEAHRSPSSALVEETSTAPHELTSFQERADEAIKSALDARQAQQVLLFGVTGSGKTEVYLRAMKHCLDNGGNAIMLVPEIALTPQVVGRFTARFKNLVAVLHSGLSDGEKRDEWMRMRKGEARIAIGARSAVFAPLENVRLLIVDEEHEPSYKQEDSPRYDAREVAWWRARYANGVVVYGSATPSLESMHRVETGQARLVNLPFRVHNRPLPPAEVVDMREELRHGNRGLFSQAMVEGLEGAVNNGHQALLFLNRRGYAAAVLCRSCGETMQCPHCDISLTLHKTQRNEWLECHYCGFRAPVPSTCPHCHEPAMRAFGIGTEQVERAVLEHWPNWRVLRMDVDTTRRKGSHQQVIQSFLNGEADILLGTQMIAKGLDFPNVAFVGVIAADTMLTVPDYRSAERTFNLLTQVSGRAGRAQVMGKSVIQTYQPGHYSVVSAANHDYNSFYQRERSVREAFRYPPFCELAVFVATHKHESYAKGAASRFERELRRQMQEDVTILSAAPSGVARVEDHYRFQVVVKYSRWDAVRTPIVAAYELVSERMRRLNGYCTLDVGAGRI